MLSSTEVRELYFDKDAHSKVEFGDMVPDSVVKYLMNFTKDSEEEYDRLAEEFDHIRAYKRDWEDSPYPPTFNTGDAIVVCGGHLLLIIRKFPPGKGQLALPGGFIRENETYRSAALRELKEETRLKVPKAVLNGKIVADRIFDYPFRSVRGRVITKGFHIQLDERPLPAIAGADDAKKAFWMPLNEVKNRMHLFFEDHYQIIESFIGNL